MGAYPKHKKQNILNLVEKTQILKNKVFVGSGYKNWEVEHKNIVLLNYKFESVIRFEPIILSFKRAIYFLFENMKKNWWNKNLFVFNNVIKKLNFSKIAMLLNRNKQAYLKIWLPGFLTNYRQSCSKSKKKGTINKKYSFYTVAALKKKMPKTIIFFSISSTNKLGVLEAKKFKLPMIGVCDTDAPYGFVQYPIFGNDDSPIAFKFYLAVINQVLASAKIASVVSEKIKTNYKKKRAEQLKNYFKNLIYALKIFFSFSIYLWSNERKKLKKKELKQASQTFFELFKLQEKNLYFKTYDYVLNEHDQLPAVYKEPPEQKEDSILKLLEDKNLEHRVKENVEVSRKDKRALKYAAFLNKTKNKQKKLTN